VYSQVLARMKFGINFGICIVQEVEILQYNELLSLVCAVDAHFHFGKLAVLSQHQ